MSLATRCPHCNTIFKVVQDQLKVSEGWVRCGRCNEVFNALEGLFDMEREPPPQRSPGHAPGSDVSASPTAPNTPPTPQPAPQTGLGIPAAAPAEAAAPAAWAGASRDLLEEAVPGTPEPDAIPPGFEDIAAVVPEPEPTRYQSAVTHFELDLPPSTLDARVMASALTPPPPAAPDSSVPAGLPITEESDALDSRYLLPSSDDKRPVRRRRRRGPDFADAEFPSDLADAEDDASWGPGWGDTDSGTPDTVPATAVEHPALDTPINRSAAAVEPAVQAPMSALRREPTDPGPSTIPSRFGDDFRPEQPLPPPSQRKGKPGTRGRAVQPEAPQFIKQAERKAIWRHPAVRVLLSLLALTLTATLGLQAAHHWRDQLAAHYPATTPWLTQWCALARCQLSAPMQIEDLQVDNIALVKTSSEGPDSYRLTAIIHNRADIALAWPQLDLTLTDSNGAVVARRAFTADTAQQVPPGADAATSGAATPPPVAAPPGSSTTLQWRLRAPDLHLAGYTAELFYP